ncbi:hypothetical protein JW992_14355 [candidate division KSB1 bacterium]|nr:hypothetical protein [candidate division KSB1 bacterium]
MNAKLTRGHADLRAGRELVFDLLLAVLIAIFWCDLKTRNGQASFCSGAGTSCLCECDRK